jgi:hypothetical protein
VSQKIEHMRWGVVLWVAGFALLTACGTPSANEAKANPSIQSILAGVGADGLDGRETVDALDRLPVDKRPDGLMASVRATSLVLTDENKNEKKLDLPSDAFYVSFAPYLTKTHPCTFHSLTTCLGEIRNTPMHVTVTDQESGEQFVSETTKTFDNGFYGMWLPRDRDFTLQVESEGKSATVSISTRGDSPTCVTDVKLS